MTNDAKTHKFMLRDGIEDGDITKLLARIQSRSLKGKAKHAYRLWTTAVDDIDDILRITHQPIDGKGMNATLTSRLKKNRKKKKEFGFGAKLVRDPAGRSSPRLF